MKRILIADASKASLVMTSEVFKDHFPGVQVVVARTSADAIDLARTCGPVDAYVIDFDLPDRDGAYTAARIKKFSQTPVLITAFDREDVREAIDRELAAYDDCQAWLKKPVKAELVVSVAQRFCEGKYRLQRRVDCRVPAVMEIALKGLPGLVPPPAKASTTSASSATNPGKTTAKKSATSALPTRLVIPIFVEDASVGGVRISVDPKSLVFGGRTKATQGSLTLQGGENLSVHLPPQDVMDAPLENVTAWQEKLVSTLRSTAAEAGRKPARAQSATLPGLQGKTRKALGEAAPDATTSESRVLKSKVMWQSYSFQEGVLTLGLQAENAALSKKFFEQIVEGASVVSETEAILADSSAKQWVSPRETH